MIYIGQTFEKDDRVYITGVRKIEDNEYYDKEKFVTLSKEVYEHCLELLYEESKKSSSPFIIFLDLALVNHGAMAVLSLDPDAEVPETNLPFVNRVDAIVVDVQNSDSSGTGETDSSASYQNIMNYAKSAISNAEDILLSRTKMYPYKLFAFSKYNIMLNARGYFITDENRDEKYIEIIDSSDEALIDIFLKYIDAYDFLSMENTIMEIFSDFKDKVKTAESKDEIDKMYLEFFSNYL